jgi:AAA+ superfamily predicted ATPase
MLSITLIRRAFTRASQITFGLKLELISAFERRSAVDKSSERAVFLHVPTGAEKFCVSIALSSRAANSVSTALNHQLLSEHLGIGALAFHSGFAEPINYSFFLVLRAFGRLSSSSP